MEKILLTEKRRYGKSTGQCLVTLGEAMQNPGEKVFLFDHGKQNRVRAGLLENTLKSIIESLGYEDIELCIDKVGDSWGVCVVSRHCPMYISDDYRMFKEIF